MFSDDAFEARSPLIQLSVAVMLKRCHLNVVVGFEDALRLHLSLGQALAKLNSYIRSTKAGKATAVNLFVYTEKSRITVNESKIRPN